ncbi:hypothetical protein [Streptomyces sp. NPDC056883]|uniref:hypothetical protein n=1 Tax=Streptomyces sp. NPDC056883 TaxID=3345959 RepID=UPI0036A4C6D7
MRRARAGAARCAALALGAALLALPACGETKVGTQNNCNTGAKCAGRDITEVGQSGSAGSGAATSPPGSPSPSGSPSVPPASGQSPPPGRPPSGSPVPSAPSSVPAPSKSPPKPSKPAQVPQAPQVHWKGDLRLSSNGGPSGWWLDRDEPEPGIPGDIGLSCDCHPGAIEGTALVAWKGTQPPGRQDCAASKGQPVEHTLEVRPGDTICLTTTQGRLGSLTVTAVFGPAEFLVTVTVWKAG